MKLTTLQRKIAEDARALIAKEYRWCQGAFARDMDGHKCRPEQLYAEKFCAVGALQRAAYKLQNDLLPVRPDDMAHEVASRMYVTDLWIFNDNHTHAEVLALFDRALAEA